MSGKKAGKYELVKTSYEDAQRIADSYGVPSLTKDDYLYAQKLFSSHGKTQRNDMPVIRRKNILLFQQRLQKGYIDINKPYAPDTNPKNPFPNGISKEQAKGFLINGLRDGDENDDKINVKLYNVNSKSLKPIQKQVYLSEVFDLYRNAGKSYLQDAFFLTTNDNFIIDGHHRFVAILLFLPEIKIKALKIDMPLKTLIPMSLTYTTAIGNIRNEINEINKEWDKLLGDLAWKYHETNSGDMYIDSKKVFDELSNKYNITMTENETIYNKLDNTYIEYLYLLLKNVLLTKNLRIINKPKFLKNNYIKKLIKTSIKYQINTTHDLKTNINILNNLIHNYNYDKVFDMLKQKYILDTL